MSLAIRMKTGPKDKKPLNLRERSKMETRTKLMNAGYELFLDKGFLKPAIAEIAERAEVSVGSFYTHFSDKENLLECIWQGIQDELQSLVPLIAVPRTDNTPGAIETRVRMVVETGLNFIEAHEAGFRFWCSGEIAASRVGRNNLELLVAWFEERARAQIEQGIFATQMHPSVCARVIAGMWSTIPIWWLDNREQVPREEVVENMVRFHLTVFK